MILIVKTIGILLVALGVVFLVNPEKLRRFIGFWKKNSKIYIAGVLQLLFGIIFLSVSSVSGWFIPFLGVLSIIKSILTFAIGSNGIKKIIDYWLVKPDSVLRWAAVAYLVIGILIIYSV
ncbi:MAG: hypothetical protein P9M06_04760 [Candidatus Saelkia tenebricola]|nr:hypothetical protein [Candidatus Saelkia tenebricola]